jgi:hypothetical protein
MGGQLGRGVSTLWVLTRAHDDSLRLEAHHRFDGKKSMSSTSTLIS